MVDGNWLWSGTVPSEGEPAYVVDRKIAQPPAGPLLVTSAHPTTVDANWPVVMRRVALALIVALTGVVVVVLEFPIVTGKLSALPSSLWKPTVTGTAADDGLTRVITVLQPPPAAMWDRTPDLLEVTTSMMIFGVTAPWLAGPPILPSVQPRPKYMRYEPGN